jgi:hypothetical protein
MNVTWWMGDKLMNNYAFLETRTLECEYLLTTKKRLFPTLVRC